MVQTGNYFQEQHVCLFYVLWEVLMTFLCDSQMGVGMYCVFHDHTEKLGVDIDVIQRVVEGLSYLFSEASRCAGLSV